MTVAPSPVRKVVSDSDDDEEKVAVKRLLSFTNQSGEYLHYTDYICGITVLKPLCRWLRLIPSPLLAFRGEPRNKTKLIISWKQYSGLDSGRRYISFVSRQLPVTCSTSGEFPLPRITWKHLKIHPLDTTQGSTLHIFQYTTTVDHNTSSGSNLMQENHLYTLNKVEHTTFHKTFPITQNVSNQSPWNRRNILTQRQTYPLLGLTDLHKHTLLPLVGFFVSASYSRWSVSLVSAGQFLLPLVSFFVSAGQFLLPLVSFFLLILIVRWQQPQKDPSVGL